MFISYSIVNVESIPRDTPKGLFAQSGDDTDTNLYVRGKPANTLGGRIRTESLTYECTSNTTFFYMALVFEQLPH